MGPQPIQSVGAQLGEVDARNRVHLSQISGVQLVDDTRHEFAIEFNVEAGVRASQRVAEKRAIANSGIASAAAPPLLHCAYTTIRTPCHRQPTRHSSPI